jgi:hypothetical protein
MKVPAVVAIILWSLLSLGQEVHVSQGKSSVALSVLAQKPYPWISGEQKTPILSVECALKGKKTLHLLKFSPGGALVEDGPEVTAKGGQLPFMMTIGGTKQVESWIPYGDAISYAYYGKTEPERVKFLQLVLSSGIISIDFKPFLTGVPTTSSFDLSKLRDEMAKYPECALQ